jgi:hypothetical protein
MIHAFIWQSNVWWLLLLKKKTVWEMQLAAYKR